MPNVAWVQKHEISEIPEKYLKIWTTFNEYEEFLKNIN